jgi:hypothetical protein
MAALLATTVYAVVFLWLLRDVVGHSRKEWQQALLLACPFCALAFCRGTAVWTVVLLAAAPGGYAAVLWIFRIVTREELRDLWMALSKPASDLRCDDAESAS